MLTEIKDSWCIISMIWRQDAPTRVHCYRFILTKLLLYRPLSSWILNSPEPYFPMIKTHLTQLIALNTSDQQLSGSRHNESNITAPMVHDFILTLHVKKPLISEHWSAFIRLFLCTHAKKKLK